jgi:beta-lactamase regulating signal transducer with metallopeptidase domain
MEPSHYLHFAGTLLTYFLQVSAGFVVCAIVVRLLPGPHLRFRAWFGFLILSGFYWFASLASYVLGFSTPRFRLFTSAANSVVVHSSHRVLIPASWSAYVVPAGTLITWGYILGVGVLLIAKAWKHVRLRLLVNHGQQASAGLQSLFDGLCHDFGVRRCSLVVLPGMISPATAYWWRPRILLPQICQQMQEYSQLGDILSHELTHIVRRDYLWAMISDVFCTLLFFHPAAWQARKNMRRERELACDRAVIEARPEHRADYATSLARFVRLRMLQQVASYGVDFASSPSLLGLRIRCILSEPVKTPLWKKLTATAGCLVFVAMFGVACPALSILMDFAGQPQTVADAVTSASASAQDKKHQAAHKPKLMAKAATENDAEASQYPDDLTSLRVSRSIHETSAYRFASAPPSGGSGEYLHTEKPAWHDSSPGSPSYEPPSVRSVVLSTIGGIAMERGERGGRGRDHDDHLISK